MVSRLQKYEKGNIFQQKAHAHFCWDFLKLNFAVTIHNFEFTLKKISVL